MNACRVRRANQAAGYLVQVKRVNGIEIDNLHHLEDMVLCCQDDFIRFDLDDDRVIAVHMATARQVLYCLPGFLS